MALRTKTVEFCFTQNEATLAAATRLDFATRTLYIPETTSRTFRSVIVQVSFRQNDALATDLTSWLIGIKLGAVAFNDATVTDTIANSGEHMSFCLTRVTDVAGYFNTNFGTGATQTCQVAVQHGGLSSSNQTAKLIITYEYEEQQTRVKTVKIPLESLVGALSTTTTEIGTNQVPNLDSFLPEASKVYRHIWFEVSGNESANGLLVDTALDLALDAEADDPDAVHESALGSDCWFLRIWQRDSMATNATHAFKAAASVASGMSFNHLTVLLCVTYEYDHTNSTTIINSLWMPFLTGRNPMGATGLASIIDNTFYIEEPATITLVQSGVLLCFGGGPTSISGLGIACGSQASRTYTHLANVVCGQFSLLQRIDSGSAQGAGITLARGKNTVTVKCITTDTADWAYPVTGFLYLNYTSGKHASGDGVHNHTIVGTYGGHSVDSLLTNFTSFQPVIPETNYWITSIALVSKCIFKSVTNNFSYCTIFLGQQAGEAGGAGDRHVWASGFPSGDPEVSMLHLHIDVGPLFRRYPNDPDASRMAVEGNRQAQMIAGSITGTLWLDMLLYITYHAITFAVSGTISNSAGGTVQIKAYEAPASGKRELLDSTSRVGNGSYSITVYDNVTDMFAEARESATLLGRSDNGVAV